MNRERRGEVFTHALWLGLTLMMCYSAWSPRVEDSGVKDTHKLQEPVYKAWGCSPPVKSKSAGKSCRKHVAATRLGLGEAGLGILLPSLHW